MFIVSPILNILSLGVTIGCIGIHANSLVESSDAQFIIGGCYVAYIVIGLANVLGSFGTEMPKTQERFFCIMGVVLFLGAGACSYKYKHQRKELIKCILSLSNAGLYAIAGLLTAGK